MQLDDARDRAGATVPVRICAISESLLVLTSFFLEYAYIWPLEIVINNFAPNSTLQCLHIGPELL